MVGLYLPPVLSQTPHPLPQEAIPPQTIISLPVHTAVCWSRAAGALVVLVAVQLSVPGLYRPPVLKKLLLPPPPPQTNMSVLHSPSECGCRAALALVVLVAVLLSV